MPGTRSSPKWAVAASIFSLSSTTGSTFWFAMKAMISAVPTMSVGSGSCSIQSMALSVATVPS